MTETAQKIGYKNLIVYQKAKLLAKDAIQYFSKTKISYNQGFLINQILRAITSIGANIAEGYGRRYKQSYRQFIAIARGSSFEVDYWLEIMFDIDLFDKNIITDFLSRNIELSKMLTAMMKRLEVAEK